MINTVFHAENTKITEEMDDKSIDLIYLDPPFNSNRDYGEFYDIWPSDKMYLMFMITRLR